MAQVTYTVKSGDNLTKIAKAHNTTVDAIVKLNPSIKDPNKIYVGQKLVISGEAEKEKTNVSSKANVDYFALVADTDREVYAGWTFDRPDVDHYEYIWYYSWGVGQAPEIKGTTEYKYCTQTFDDYVTHVSFIVRPVAKKKKDSKGNETVPWVAEWSTKKTYWFKDNPPKTPPTPNVEIEDYTLTAILTNLEDLNADYIEFHVYQDNGHLFAYTTKPHSKIVTYQASFTCTIDPGHEYKVQARAWRGEEHSEWSGYSGNQQTKPAAPSGITTCRATTSTSVYLEWGSVGNATSYDIEYATKREYLEGSNQSTTSSGITTTSYTLTGLQSGQEYFFRVRAVNNQGESAWSSIKSLVLGKKPSPPTTWSSTTTAISGEPVYLYWVHNSEDGSKQVKAELEISINGEADIVTIENPTAGDEEAEEKTSSYTLNTSGAPEGINFQWRVRTCGITGEYSDWSIRRTVDVYGPPTLSLNVLGSSVKATDTLTWDGNTEGLETLGDEYYRVVSYCPELPDVNKAVVTGGVLEVECTIFDLRELSGYRCYAVVSPDETVVACLFTEDAFSDGISVKKGIYLRQGVTSLTIPGYMVFTEFETITDTLAGFPFRIIGKAGPNTQTPIGYHISIVANESYETIDRIGNPRYVKKGHEVYSKHFDISENLDIILSANDVDLENNISYTIVGVVTMDSGLTSETTLSFVVAWEDMLYMPNAEIGIDKETYSAALRPYCEDENGELIEDVTLAVYRRTYNGSFVKIADNLANTKATFVVDPHPELDYARYRIIATTGSTGAICYGDLGAYPVGGTAVIIQWDEIWSDFDVTDDGSVSESRPWSGSMLKLPYNIDVSEGHKIDVAHIEYIGREHPVSYYGTQLGETATWTTEIPATDKETLYALRRLATWTGDCYVREPSGTGYWATVSVSINLQHCKVTVPVTLNITRVEGGV